MCWKMPWSASRTSSSARRERWTAVMEAVVLAGEVGGDFSIKLEEQVLITETGYRLLGKPIPKTIDDVEAMKC